jgi:hypothetical protein
MNQTQGEMAFTATIGSGESWDLLITADDKSPIYKRYITSGKEGFEALNTQVANFPPPFNRYANIPLEGTWGLKPNPDPNGPPLIYDFDYFSYSDNPNSFFPQWYIMHNHDDYKVVNSDFYHQTSMYPGGQLTFIQTDR